jgi:hypothetical protein
MARPIIASKLIKSVRNRALIPTDTSVFTDEDILEILNEEVTQGLLATIMSLNEEHMVDHIDIPVDSSDDLSGGIKIPERAVGNKLRDVSYIRENNVYELSRITLEELSDYRNDFDKYSYNLDLFYVEGDRVKFVSNKVAADFVRVYFYMMPNDIITEDKCGKTFSITDNGNDTTTLTLVSIPDDFSNLPTMDIVSNKVPNKIIGYDIEPISVNRTQKTVTFNTEDLPDSLETGAYICEQYTSPYLNMPTEMHALLAQRASIYILEALGDTEGLRNAMMRLQGMENSIQTILEDRVEGAPQKINPRHSTLSQTFWVGTRGKGRR